MQRSAQVSGRDKDVISPLLRRYEAVAVPVDRDLALNCVGTVCTGKGVAVAAQTGQLTVPHHGFHQLLQLVFDMTATKCPQQS